MSAKPWINGPKELLGHGLYHLKQDTDFDRRMAIICIDNSVEVMIKTFLGLPTRATGLKITRKQYDEFTQTFPKLLDGLDEFAPDRIRGLALEDLEWLHRIRNQLYHEGNGITVEKEKVELYAGIAKELLRNLFDVEPDLDSENEITGEKFIIIYAELERLLRVLSERQTVHYPTPNVNLALMTQTLYNAGILTQEIVDEFTSLSATRNSFVHGLSSPSAEQLKQMMISASRLRRMLLDLIR